MLEYNDLSGVKTRLGQKAKEEAKISTFDIPKHSPCLDVCDYYLWSAVNTRMREQERHWPMSKKEAREGFMKRLRRTALATPLLQCGRPSAT